ncbi:MAG: PEP-CTERM sorting domain-containing protein [Anaerohalosphaeraceae bacterium]
MKNKCIFQTAVVVMLMNLSCSALALIIEPDNYSDRTELSQVSPGVTVSVTTSDNQIVDIWPVTADVDSMGYAPTGSMVFSHVHIPFWNTDRRLRVDFSAPVSSISLMAAGTDYFDYACQGWLNVYDSHFNLLDSYQTSPLREYQVETMQIDRAAGDISYAIAYTTGDNPFGRLDRLEFSVPEPATLSLLMLGFAATLRRPGRKAN